MKNGLEDSLWLSAISNKEIFRLHTAKYLSLILMDRHPAVAGLKEESMQKLPDRNTLSGHGLPARVHYENTHFVSAHSDFSRAVMQTMLFLHPSRP